MAKMTKVACHGIMQHPVRYQQNHVSRQNQSLSSNITRNYFHELQNASVMPIIFRILQIQAFKARTSSQSRDIVTQAHFIFDTLSKKMISLSRNSQSNVW